jgi:hypothetical protein
MKYQPSFSFGEIDLKPAKRPLDNKLFIAYIKQVAPQLITSTHPIHRTKTGYATNTSPYNGIGQLELDLNRAVVIHRHTNPVLVGNIYEYPLVEDLYHVEFRDDRMIVQ